MKNGAGIPQDDSSIGGASPIHHSSFIIIHHSKIIALSASAFEHERGAMIAAGCDDFLAKPFRVGEMFAKLAEHLGVRYVYETHEKPVDESSAMDALAASGRLAALPAEWLAEMKAASIRGSPRTARGLVDRIRERDERVADLLDALVRDLALDEIVELIDRAAPAPPIA
jgi:two-component system sensor histidine kinase/response regulator